MATALASTNDNVNDLNEHDLSHKQQQLPDSDESIRCDQLWAFLLSVNGNSTPNMKMLLCYLFSIPCSNAYVESIFSHMKHSWNDYRNNMDIGLVAAKLQIRLNCSYSCNSFHQFLLSQPKLLKKIRTNEKY